MEKSVLIYCKNTNEYRAFPIGTTLLEIYKDMNLNLPYMVTSARVNNVIRELNFAIYKPKNIEFIDLSTSSGRRTYVRSLSFVLYMAVKELFPDVTLSIEHAVSKGYFIRLISPNGDVFIPDNLSAIEKRMFEIISADIPFVKEETETEKVIAFFEKESLSDKVRLLKTRGSVYTEIYRLGPHVDYYNGSLLPSTGWISLFGLENYFEGFLLRVPSVEDPLKLEPVIKQDKMFDIFNENIEFNRIMNVSDVGSLNELIINKKTKNLVKVAEALQEKKIIYIADKIASRIPRTNIVLISGPSSSGKTTFSKRLGIQLFANSIFPKSISLDDYFVERVNTPRDENGDYDYESLYALDLDLFRSDLEKILNGERVSLPTYNFETGKREYNGNTLQLKERAVLILEGIHALNPELTSNIPAERKFGVYVSALTTISLDNHNWIPTSDNRLIRRIIRDYNTRGYSAKETISRWKSVREGEEKWIFPFQENADAMFNSALIFELSVLRKHAEYILSEVPQNCEEYSEAYRLLKFIRDFKSFPEREIPRNSLLREFVGGSNF